MDRNPISDLEAVAAMPGLEQLAAVIARHVQPGRGSAADPVSMMIFLAGRWAFGSANTFDSAARSTDLWETLRGSAARVGRVLPEPPPTFSQLSHLRRAATAGLGSDLSLEFTKVAVELAKSVGLLNPDDVEHWDKPSASTVIYGDGSVFRPLSSVTMDDEGVVQGSRAKLTPRIGPHFKGKKGDDHLSGIPIAAVGCHGRRRWQRVLLAFDYYVDRNEIGSSMKLFKRVIELAGGGVSHVVYDRLMAGIHVRELLKQGVIPVVAMTEAGLGESHVKLPYELQRTGYRSAGVQAREKMSDREAKKVAPKERLTVHHWTIVDHPTPNGRCSHDLSALDGAVVTTPPGVDPTLDSLYVRCIDLTWRELADGQHPIGTLLVPCQPPFTVEIDFAADRKGRKSKNGSPSPLADWIRPIPEITPYSSSIEGLRSDVESVFSSLKALLPRNRAGSLDPDDFLLDAIGAGLHCNAVAWDVHVSLHTRCAQHEAKLDRRGLRRKPVTA